MRTLGISAALIFAISAHGAWAQDSETASSTGCGLGTMLFEGEKGPAPQILAVTTNGTSGNQTFGISSGTLGCEQDAVVRSPTKVKILLISSLDNLATDVARGQGETLESLAALMDVEQTDKPRFFATLQGDFGRIFPSENVTADEVIVSINAVLAEDARLQRYVIA
ncbi:MAG: DUF3015 domain-containing protein [Pseudomonadota bacterium]